MITVIKKNGRFSLRHLFAEFKSLDDGYYAISITKTRKTRTNEQNRWLWGCVYPMLLQGLLDAGWEFTSVDQVHEFFKGLFAREKLVNFHTGEIIEIPSSTKIMDTVTFSTYVDALRNYAQEYLSIEIPEPI